MVLRYRRTLGQHRPAPPDHCLFWGTPMPLRDLISSTICKLGIPAKRTFLPGNNTLLGAANPTTTPMFLQRAMLPRIQLQSPLPEAIWSFKMALFQLRFYCLPD